MHTSPIALPSFRNYPRGHRPRSAPESEAYHALGLRRAQNRHLVAPTRCPHWVKSRRLGRPVRCPLCAM